MSMSVAKAAGSMAASAAVVIGLVLGVNAAFSDGRAGSLGSFMAPPSGEPTLGTATPPAIVRDALERYRPEGQPARRVDRIDVLAASQVGRTRLVTGGDRRPDGTLCYSTYQVVDGEAETADSACIRASDLGSVGNLTVERSLSLGSDVPAWVTGRAPPNAARVELVSAELNTSVSVTGGGDRWGGATFFVASWPSGPTTEVRAYDSRGRVIATTMSAGLDTR